MKLSVCFDNTNDNSDDKKDNDDDDDEFLSHPIEEKKHSLLKHSIEVAERTRKLLSYTRFQHPELGFFSGLLHDIGKLNPYYQILFRKDKSERDALKSELVQKYEPVHSPYSAWIAKKLLQKKQNRIDPRILKIIITLIYGHHTRHRRSIGEVESSEKFTLTQQAMISNLERFCKVYSNEVEFTGLSWDNCLTRFRDPISFEIQLASNSIDPVDDFLEICVSYSCLLQADRGVFSAWEPANFDLRIDTSKLVRRNSRLFSIRRAFQSEVLNNFDYDSPISIVNAPTGVGKTKVFLDLMSSLRSKYQNLERIYYFSPLLALTEDFERKLSDTTQSLDEILVYNHLFSGSIEEKNRFESGIQFYESGWIFDNESFNRPFVITTTQRLLITIFSNKHADKLKLASFRNSLLIIDEVQTIPKYILRILIHILERMFYFLGTRTLLVSATIPYELKSIPTAKISSEQVNSYLNLTKKYVSYVPWSSVNIKEGRTLVMANTRRKAAGIFQQLVDRFPDAMYLSSGIRKIDRNKILTQVHEKEQSKHPFILVSTQVVEAGVDLSFSQIFREKAPLDSIIQVMGRLNREAENDQASLVIYNYDTEHRPYSQLELNESEKRLMAVKNSIDLYSVLDEYYESISGKNQLYQKYANKLDERITKLDFDGVWEFISKYVLEDERDPVLIPELRDWNEVKELLMKKRLTKTDYRRFSNMTASLPRKVHDLDIVDKFDPDVLEKNILLPKKENLNEVYDSVLGTDRLIVRGL
jgi:CRISPR-associated endonuclease/helicase Cas3